VNTDARKIKVLIVDDSPTVVMYLKHLFNSTDTLQVIGTACNGKKAVEFVRHTRPDIITMDVRMPVMDGFEATREIMSTDPIPIVILSANFDPVEVEQSFRAVEAGALASFAKPSGMASAENAKDIRELVAAMEALAHVKLVRRRAPAPPRAQNGPEAVSAVNSIRKLRNPGIVVIGVSTGGPPVLQAILAGLAKDFKFPVLIVQHISKGFTQGLADWLGNTSALPVMLGRHGDLLSPGRVMLAPDDRHMEVGADEQIVLTEDAPDQGLRPAVSRLFYSASAVYGPRAIAVLLTGMGSDGAREMLNIKDRGGVTIAQDEGSCVVYGMPKVAVQLNAVKHVLSPAEIVNTLNGLSAKQ
jgi:two-component system chemotaxis response regulator CheB